jgi:hypothetical protein
MVGRRRDKDTQQPLNGLWALVLTNSAVVAAVLYISGWVYLYYFFKSFSIDVSQLELAWSDVLVYSAVLVREAVQKIFCSAWFIVPVLMFGLFMLVDRWAISLHVLTSKIGQINALYFVPLLLSFVFIYGIISFARYVGLQAASSVRVGFGSHVTLQWSKDCSFSDTVEFNILNKGGFLKPLFSTPKWIYLYAQTGEWSSNRTKISIVRVVQIPAGCVSAMDMAVSPSN